LLILNKTKPYFSSNSNKLDTNNQLVYFNINSTTLLLKMLHANRSNSL
jgi:hypothetical protein